MPEPQSSPPAQPKQPPPAQPKPVLPDPGVAPYRRDKPSRPITPTPKPTKQG
jgi:hypothetical protein